MYNILFNSQKWLVIDTNTTVQELDGSPVACGEKKQARLNLWSKVQHLYLLISVQVQSSLQPLVTSSSVLTTDI